MESDPIRVRTGVHTGEPIVSDNLYAGVDVTPGGADSAWAQATADRYSFPKQRERSRRPTYPMTWSCAISGASAQRLSRPVRIYQLGSDEHPPLKTLYRTNLPYQPTPFVGRERELDETGALLTREDVRLVALTGAGGSGKTRLGLQVAAESAEHFRDGVYWVSLAPIQDAELVLPALARALDVREVSGQALDATVRTALGQRTMLILFDNFEHVLEGGRCSPTCSRDAPVCTSSSRAVARCSSRANTSTPSRPFVRWMRWSSSASALVRLLTISSPKRPSH